LEGLGEEEVGNVLATSGGYGAGIAAVIPKRAGVILSEAKEA
jgi:hypothetical protein